jgi:hypothetical protein
MTSPFEGKSDKELSEMMNVARQEMSKYKQLLKKSTEKAERHELQLKYNAAKAVVDGIKEYRKYEYEIGREYISAIFDD